MLNSNHIKVLGALFPDKELRAKEIHGISDSMKYRILRNLVDDGLVKTRMDESVRWERRRVMWYSLTEEGREHYELSKMSV